MHHTTTIKHHYWHKKVLLGQHTANIHGSLPLSTPPSTPHPFKKTLCDDALRSVTMQSRLAILDRRRTTSSLCTTPQAIKHHFRQNQCCYGITLSSYMAPLPKPHKQPSPPQTTVPQT